MRFFFCPTHLPLWQVHLRFGKDGAGMGTKGQKRLFSERSIEAGVASSGAAPPVRPVRSVTVNGAESPLGWLFARGLVTQRQYDAGERLRADWERAQFAPRVTMAWDAAPVAKGRGGSAFEPDLSGAQIDARRRFQGAVGSAGPASRKFFGASFARGTGCARPRAHLAGRRAL